MKSQNGIDSTKVEVGEGMEMRSKIIDLELEGISKASLSNVLILKIK